MENNQLDNRKKNKAANIVTSIIVGVIGMVLVIIVNILADLAHFGLHKVFNFIGWEAIYADILFGSVLFIGLLICLICCAYKELKKRDKQKEDTVNGEQ